MKHFCTSIGGQLTTRCCIRRLKIIVKICCGVSFGLMGEVKLIMNCLEMFWHLILPMGEINTSVHWLCSQMRIITYRLFCLLVLLYQTKVKTHMCGFLRDFMKR